MTDKEQIMIDGVDVTECEEFYRACVNTQEPEVICKKYEFCSENPNCYFKSLARKTQECENLKKDYKELEQRHDEAFKDFERLKQECEELKTQLMQKDEINTFFNSPIEGWSSYPCGICQYKGEYARYRKALEEIKEYTREQFCDNCEDIGSTEYNCHCEYCEYQEYFDIISKAKGEGE